MNKEQLKQIIKEELTKMLSEEQSKSDTYDVDGETYTVLYNTYVDEDGTLTPEPRFQAILDPNRKPIMRRYRYNNYADINYMTLDGKSIHSVGADDAEADFGLADAVRAMKVMPK